MSDALMKPAVWRHQFPFESHWLDLGGPRMHYVDEFVDEGLVEATDQSPPVLLFVHGNPTWSFHWRRLISAFRSRFRCIAMDHLGCGMSDLQPKPLRLSDHIDNIRRLVRTLNLSRITLIAQDWGGAIGLGALLAERERFERIVLFNTGAFPPPFIPWRIRICRWPVVGKLAVQGANAFSRAALRMTLTRQWRLETDVVAGYLAPYHSWKRRAAVYHFVRDIPSSTRHPTWQTLQRIEAKLPTVADWPTMLIWGMRDWCFTPDCLDRFGTLWPNASIYRLTDVGHWVVEDAPAEAIAEIAKFVASSTREVPSRRLGSATTVNPNQEPTVVGQAPRTPN